MHRIFWVGVIGLLLHISLVSAEFIEVRALPTRVYGGDNIGLVVGVRNSYSPQQHFTVAYGLACPDIDYTPILQEHKFILGPGSFRRFAQPIQVPEGIYGGECFVQAQLMAQNDSDKILDSSTVDITVIGASPPPTLVIKTCEESYCETEKTVFDLGETTYIRYRPTIPEAKVTAHINKPGGRQEDVIADDDGIVSYVADEVGSYSVILDVETSEYGTLKLKRDFAVVSDEPVIESTTTLPSTKTTTQPTGPTCGDGVCEKGESKSSCQADCEGEGVSPLIIAGGVIILVAVGYLVSKAGTRQQP